MCLSWLHQSGYKFNSHWICFCTKTHTFTHTERYMGTVCEQCSCQFRNQITRKQAIASKHKANMKNLPEGMAKKLPASYWPTKIDIQHRRHKPGKMIKYLNVCNFLQYYLITSTIALFTQFAFSLNRPAPQTHVKGKTWQALLSIATKSQAIHQQTGNNQRRRFAWVHMAGWKCSGPTPPAIK